ncbi:MAG: PAS domain-containing protein [Deltaproteobacteria bacterium]|nr:PAS domain-containing protein [Deltaproteobacteria bacterium]
MNAGQEKILKERLERLKNQNKTLREKSAVLRKEKGSLEKALKVSQKLLNDIPGAIVLIQDGKLIFINEIPRTQLGYNEEEIIGRNFLEFIHPRSKEFVRNLHQRRIAGKSVQDQYEAFLATKSGEPLCCEVRVRKIRHQGRDRPGRKEAERKAADAITEEGSPGAHGLRFESRIQGLSEHCG